MSQRPAPLVGRKGLTSETRKGRCAAGQEMANSERREKIGASHDQADAQRSKKSTFQAIRIQFSVMDIVTKSFEMSKTGLGIS
jgi:hypothetical protein